MGPFLILGCGFTGVRAAKLLLARGLEVHAVVRHAERLSAVKAAGGHTYSWSLESPLALPALPEGAIVLHSLPDVPDDQRQVFREYLESLKPSRVVYLSTTGVYGSHSTVDEFTSVDGCDEKSLRRIDEEGFVRSGNWSSLVLRPAAIYGPGRGVHVHIRNGREPRSQSGMVSRIHVDDLAAIAVEGLLSNVAGAWPVADELPASSIEVAALCRKLLGIPESTTPAEQFQIAGRSVDGSGVLKQFNLQLQYRDYRSGIPACLNVEQAAG